MINNLMYIELKTGYSDDGPAWIGYVKTSKSKKTIYFNDHAFQKNIGNYANYIDNICDTIITRNNEIYNS